MSKNINKSWIVKVDEDPKTKELFLPLPDDLLDAMGWVEGTELKWIRHQNNSYTLKEIKKNALSNRS